MHISRGRASRWPEASQKTVGPARAIFRHEIFPEFRNFLDLRGHSRGNPRSGLIFMPPIWGVPYIVCAR